MSGTPPTHLVTEDDHGAWLTTVAGILLTWMVLTLAMRVFIRLRFNGPWMNDDTTCTIASILGICQTGVTFAAITHGYGKKLFLLDAEQVVYIQKALYASDLLYIASLAGSKISASFLIARLTRQKTHTIFSITITVLSFLWGIAGVFAIALRCDLSQPWSFNASTGYCVSQFPRWIGLESISMFIETLLFILAINLVWSLHMAFRLKTIVVVAFSSRILVLVPTALRLYYLSPSQNPRVTSAHSPTPNVPTYEPFFTSIYAALLTQTVMHYALIAATIPCTKPFMKAFAGSLAVPSDLSSSGRGGSQPRTGYGDGYAFGGTLNSLTSNHRKSHTRGSSVTKPILFAGLSNDGSEKINPRASSGMGMSSAGRDSAFSPSHSRGPSGASGVGGVPTTTASASGGAAAGSPAVPPGASRPRAVTANSANSKASLGSTSARVLPSGGDVVNSSNSNNYSNNNNEPTAGEKTNETENASNHLDDGSKAKGTRSRSSTSPHRAGGVLASLPGMPAMSLAMGGRREERSGSGSGSDYSGVITRQTDVDVRLERA